MQNLIFVLLLIIIANGAPIVVRYVVGERLRYPVDFYQTFFDGNRIFGNSKTWIGLCSMPASSMVAAWVMDLGIEVGGWVGVGAVIGDLFSSFVKRRLKRKESSMVVGLDQIPESLIPLLLVNNIMNFNLQEVTIAVILFIAFELLVSRLLYCIHVRKQPY